MMNNHQMEYSPVQQSIQNIRVQQVYPESVLDSPTKKKEESIKATIPHSNQYRADIDGLRTISIIVVVCHHAWTGLFRGGYMGVDIFFVISGYLISKIIFKELRKQQSFSYSKFYSRRIRRIYPALIAMLIYSFILLCQCYSSEELKEASESLMAACLMGVNIHMMYKQYTHDQSWNYVQVLWTLGVEEQFYLFWPFFATQLWKLSMTKGLITIGIAIFILYQLFLDNKWNTIEMTLQRLPFWQILIGCFVAFYQQKKLQMEQNSQQSILTINVNQITQRRQETLWERTKSAKGILSSIATLLIIFSIAKQHNINKYIFWNWVSTVGAAVYIHCGRGIFNDFLLGNKVTIFIGKISYAWYLTHFPLLKFCNFFTDNLFTKVLTGFILAILFTYGIENKIRFSKSKYVIPGLVLAMAILAILFFTVYLFPSFWALQKTP